MAKEFKAFHGHVPRDRGSIWYLAPLFGNIWIGALALFLLAAVVFGRS